MLVGFTFKFLIFMCFFMHGKLNCLDLKVMAYILYYISWRSDPLLFMVLSDCRNNNNVRIMKDLYSAM